MKSWNLKNFTKEYGYIAAAGIWGISHQAVRKAEVKKRDIQIVLMDDEYQVRESKVLAKKKAHEVVL